MRINEVSTNTIRELWSGVEAEIGGCSHLEEVAQLLMSALRERFADSVALARMFVTMPFEALPGRNQGIVAELSESAGLRNELKPTTPVLSLVGTRGVAEDWNSRFQSRGHVGIPLLSSSFISGIPMIARLLKELGLPLEWIDSQDSSIIKNTLGKVSGLFFVDRAAEAKDNAGRLIIPGQSFVSEYGIESVFGVGGAYFGGAVMVMILFCHDSVERSAAKRFLPLVNYFKSKTGALVKPSRVLRPEDPHVSAA